MTKSQPERERLFTGGGLASASLQRRCACGHPSSGKECAQCGDKNKPEPMRKTQQAMRTGAQSMATLEGQPHSFGHDFSRVQIRSETEHPSPAFSSQRNSSQLKSSSERVKQQSFYCPPAGDSITAISAATGGGGTLGVTTIDKASKLICSPKFKVDAKAGYCTFDPVAVSLSQTSKFANPTPEAITADTLKVPGCGNKDVPVFFKITAADSALAQKAEQEHCDDLTLAFNQTLLPCSTELNKFAGTKIPGKSDDECFKSLKAKMGFDPDECTLEFVALADKSKERDDPPQSFHDFDPVLISKDCKKILSGLKKSATNKIGDPTVAPPKWIPPSTKCPKTKAAATAPATSPTPSPSPSPGGNKPAPAPKSPKKEDQEKQR